jgi:uncharacterized membrane protein YvbJ
MRKCPNCAEENMNESLFCKNCGRCLIAADPEEVQRSTATHTEYYKTPEGIDFYDRHRVKKSRVYSLKRRHQTVPSVMAGWLLLLNLLAFVLMSEIARYIVNR